MISIQHTPQNNGLKAFKIIWYTKIHNWVHHIYNCQAIFYCDYCSDHSLPIYIYQKSLDANNCRYRNSTLCSGWLKWVLNIVAEPWLRLMTPYDVTIPQSAVVDRKTSILLIVATSMQHTWKSIQITTVVSFPWFWLNKTVHPYSFKYQSARSVKYISILHVSLLQAFVPPHNRKVAGIKATYFASTLP